MPNFPFGDLPNQIPRNHMLGRLARVDMLPFRKLLFTSSQTWSPSRPVWANIYVTGAGASPGANSSLYDGSTGGGAGGTAIKFGVLLLPTVVYTLVVGAGGAQAAVGQNGNHGSDSSFSGTGVTTLTGQGGRQGNRLLQSTAAANSFVSAKGGIATGGDLNLSGGQGIATMGVYPPTMGDSLSSFSPRAVVMAGQGGASFWGAGGHVTQAPDNFGEGAGGTGMNATSQGFAGKQGVIMIEFNE